MSTRLATNRRRATPHRRCGDPSATTVKSVRSIASRGVRLKSFVRYLLVFACLLLPRVAHADELRVVSWNVWGVPYVTPSTDARIDAIADAVAPLEVDVLALQEVWEPEHGERLRERLAAIGLTHTIHWIDEDRREQSGLMIASRWPIEELAFERFAMGGDPLVPWHVDYMADKGVALVRVDAPGRSFVLANTHLQAVYGGFEYTPIRIGQMLQLAALLARVEGPLVVAGDLNTRQEELGFRALVARSGLADAAPGFGIDALLHRGGLRTLGHVRAFDRPLPTREGTMRLSDHDALVVDLGFAPEAPREAGLRDAHVASLRDWTSEGWLRVRDELRAFATVNGADWSRVGGGYRVVGLVALAFVASRWRRRRRRHVLRALAVTALALLYLGFAYGPSEASVFERLLRETTLEASVPAVASAT